MRVVFADRCAWRAVYVYIGQNHVFTLGLDPKADRGPCVFFRVLRVRKTVRVPHLRWQHPSSAVRRLAYSLQSRVLHGLDGRYGWGHRQ